MEQLTGDRPWTNAGRYWYTKETIKDRWAGVPSLTCPWLIPCVPYEVAVA